MYREDRDSEGSVAATRAEDWVTDKTERGEGSRADRQEKMF